MASSNTTIEWCDKTWNPLRGCTRVSEGCKHCYAEKIAYRFSGPGHAFEGLAKKVGNEARWTGKVMLVEKELETPFSWKNPSKVFVNSVSDLFHESVPFDFIDEVFYTMALAERHTFQILTKRPERMLEYFRSVEERFRLQLGRIWFSSGKYIARHYGTDFLEKNWPLKNVWLGVSVEDQKTADERIPLLLQVPAAIRFLSCEPLLGPVDFLSARLNGPCGYYCDESVGHVDHGHIDWVIAGGESGPGARPAHPDWFRNLRDDCQRAHIPYFFKQWGNWLPYEPYEPQPPFWTNQAGDFLDGHTFLPDMEDGEHKKWSDAGYLGILFNNVGKKAAGRELDGRTHDDMPQVEVLV
jgi:protein gp37